MPPLLPTWLCRFIILNKCHMYKAKFLSKSRICNSNNKNLIRIMWPLGSCQAYILTLLQDSNNCLENCRRSCWNTNPSIPGFKFNFFSHLLILANVCFCNLLNHIVHLLFFFFFFFCFFCWAVKTASFYYFICKVISITETMLMWTFFITAVYVAIHLFLNVNQAIC